MLVKADELAVALDEVSLPLNVCFDVETSWNTDALIDSEPSICLVTAPAAAMPFMLILLPSIAIDFTDCSEPWMLSSTPLVTVLSVEHVFNVPVTLCEPVVVEVPLVNVSADAASGAARAKKAVVAIRIRFKLGPLRTEWWLLFDLLACQIRRP